MAKAGSSKPIKKKYHMMFTLPWLRYSAEPKNSTFTIIHRYRAFAASIWLIAGLNRLFARHSLHKPQLQLIHSAIYNLIEILRNPVASSKEPSSLNN